MIEYLIGKYLEDEEIVIGNLHYSKKPETTSLTTTIYSEAVPQPAYVQGFNSDFVGVKFLTRSQVNQEAKKLAYDIHKNLSQLGSIEIETTHNIGGVVYDWKAWIVSVDIVTPPTDLEIDDKGRFVVVSHYSVHAQTEGNKFRKATITEPYEEEVEEEP